VQDDISASPSPGHNEPYWDVPPTYSYGPPVVEQYNGHDFVTSPATATGGSGYHAHGIWIDGVHEATYKVLRCPSDPSAPPDGLVYGHWGPTNYLANYNAFSGNPWGLWCNPVPLSYFKDGLSNTVLFAEGYADCDRIGRIALYSWWYHNFGLDWYQQPNTNLFQTSPKVLDCDNWRAQSGHSGGMNVGLGDGSVRFVSGSVSPATWTAVLLPRDGAVPGNDW
jgi:prepilin-type processing-associated H-X9-DG protein